MKHKKYHVDIVQMEPIFHTDYAIFPKDGHSSICYCTSKEYAELVAAALENFDVIKYLKELESGIS